jgi:hypothetical protein
MLLITINTSQDSTYDVCLIPILASFPQYSMFVYKRKIKIWSKLGCFPVPIETYIYRRHKYGGRADWVLSPVSAHVWVERHELIFFVAHSFRVPVWEVLNKIKVKIKIKLLVKTNEYVL